MKYDKRRSSRNRKEKRRVARQRAFMYVINNPSCIYVDNITIGILINLISRLRTICLYAVMFSLMLTFQVYAMMGPELEESTVLSIEEDEEPIVTDKNEQQNIEIIEEENDKHDDIETEQNEMPEEIENIVQESSTSTVVEETIEKEPTHLYYKVVDEGITYTLSYDYQDFVYDECVKNDIQNYYDTVIALMYHESSFEEDLISDTDDYGLMQINKCNHKWLKSDLGLDNMLNPYQNITAGTYIISMLIHKYNNIETALVSYNMGESAVIDKGIYSSTYSRGVIEDIDKLVVIEKE